MGGGGKTPRMLVFLGEAVLTAAVAWIQLQKCLPVTTLTHQGLCWALQTWRAQAVLAVYCLCPALCPLGMGSEQSLNGEGALGTPSLFEQQPLHPWCPA